MTHVFIQRMDEGWGLPVRLPDFRPPRSDWSCPNKADPAHIERLVEFADVPRELAEMVGSVASEHMISITRMRSPSRVSWLIAARCDLTVRARAEGFSWWQIGRALNRDHSTIRSAFNKAVNGQDRSIAA